MSMPALFKGRLSLPVIGAPLFIISVPDLVIAQCKAGIVGSFPALNARPPALLDEWLVRIKEELAAYDKAHEPKKLVILPGGHFDAYVKGFEAASVPARDWFAQHLAP